MCDGVLPRRRPTTTTTTIPGATFCTSNVIFRKAGTSSAAVSDLDLNCGLMKCKATQPPTPALRQLVEEGFWKLIYVAFSALRPRPRRASVFRRTFSRITPAAHLVSVDQVVTDDDDDDVVQAAAAAAATE